MENNKTVLVIDDESHIRRVIELKLKNNGYQVITAENGEEGFHLIEARHPDVVITDINMPKLDGKKLCILTNPFKKKRSFLTIIITVRVTPDDQDWISQMDETVFMEKPFSPSKLLECIDHYFGMGR